MVGDIIRIYRAADGLGFALGSRVASVEHDYYQQHLLRS